MAPVFGEAVHFGYVPQLQQFILPFPTMHEERETAECVEPILSRVRPSTVVRVVGEAGMGVDEAEFWETPAAYIAKEVSEEVTGVESRVY
jgi:hypothetical protein